jgi:CubicO group peptidase (beta-lactamase class C family)
LRLCTAALRVCVVIMSFSAFLDTRVREGDPPVLAAAIVDREGVRYEQAFGQSDLGRKIAATPDAIFRIASMTKPITCLAAMILVEEGRIALEDPVARHLPDEQQAEVLVDFDEASGTYTSRPPRRPITIRDLLTNTSGMAYPLFSRALLRLHTGGVVRLPLLHDPGARWTYGPSTAVLGRVVAAVSGHSLDEFCQARIFDPLGMTDTGYAVPDAKRDRVVTVHRRDAAGVLKEQPNPPVIRSKNRGDDGLFSTARDYAAFLQLFLNRGHGIVRPETVDAMLSNQIGTLTIERQTTADPALARSLPSGRTADAFGFGFQIAGASMEGGRRVGSASWAGVFNTYFWIDPSAGIAAVLMMQLLPAYDDTAISVLRGFERQVYLQT